MQVYRSGYYQWLNQPISNRELENQELLIQIKELGIRANKKRAARLMSKAKLYDVGTYCQGKPYSKAGLAHKAHLNHLQQCFIANYPNESWVSDITYIKTHEEWIFLATVIDLFSRKAIGWATRHCQTTPSTIGALKMAAVRLGENSKIILHSDQGSQYSSYNYLQFAKKHNIILSMSRRGNCYDNVVAENFFKTLKKAC